MKLITLTDDHTGVTVQHIVSADELETLSGVQLAALLLPHPTGDDVTVVNEFLDHYRGAA